jgi:transcriptional regulator with XRE-family HTH domain
MLLDLPTRPDATLLRAKRRALGIRLCDLADAVGISTSYLSKIERLRVRPNGAIKAKLAAVLGVPRADLLKPPTEVKS